MYFGGAGWFWRAWSQGHLICSDLYVINTAYVYYLYICHKDVGTGEGGGGLGGDLATPLPKHFFANLDVNNNDNSFFACQDFS